MAISKTVSRRFLLVEQCRLVDHRAIRQRSVLDHCWSFHIGKYLLPQKEDSMLAKCLNIKKMWIRGFESQY